MFKVRTTAPNKDNPYYYWGVPSEGQCTWGVYGRVKECGFVPCCWFDRSTQAGSYTNAKDWLENYRDPWEVKDASWKPVAGDVGVFTGNLGHVIFIERIEGNVALVSDWNRVAPLTYCSSKWNINEPFKGVGELLGYLHYPYNAVEPVERNENVDQIECTDDTLRIRTEPNLNGQIVGHVQIGFYNVLNRAESDGYTWYEIAKDRWCADITTKYLPKGDSDFVEEIRKWADNMVTTIKMKDEKIADMTKDMKTISDISKKWE